MNIFHKIQSVLEFHPRKQDSPSDCPSVRLLVRPGTLFPSAREVLNSNIQLWQALGYQAAIEETQEQIPDGYICLRIVRDEKQREWRSYLQPRIKIVEEMKFYWTEIDSLTQQGYETDQDNIVDP